MVKIGIISFAHMHAYSYARALVSMPDVVLAGIADDDRERGTKAAEEFNTKYFESCEELLNSNIEGVIICSENSKHTELTISAAEHKKHVLCEKPIAANMDDAKKMIESCKKAGVKLEIAFPCRFHPAVARLRQIIKSKELGEIVAIRGTNHGQMPDGWFIDKEKSGGGAVFDHTVHVVDLMRWFLGKEITKVYAESGTLLHDVNIDDCGLLSLELGESLFATLDTSWSRPKSFPTWGDVTMEVVGTKGIGHLDMFAQKISVYEEGNLTHRYENWGSDSDLLLIEDFVNSLANGKEPLISGEDGLKAMEVALAAYQSIGSHKPVALF